MSKGNVVYFRLFGLLAYRFYGNPFPSLTVKLSAFTRMVRRANLSGLRLHDLRHTFASLMVLLRAKPKVISGALVHSSVAFTMDVYSHIIERMQSDATALLDEVLPAGKNRAKIELTPTFRKLVSKHGDLALSPCSSEDRAAVS